MLDDTRINFFKDMLERKPTDEELINLEKELNELKRKYEEFLNKKLYITIENESKI